MIVSRRNNHQYQQNSNHPSKQRKFRNHHHHRNGNNNSNHHGDGSDGSSNGKEGMSSFVWKLMGLCAMILCWMSFSFCTSTNIYIAVSESGVDGKRKEDSSHRLENNNNNNSHGRGGGGGGGHWEEKDCNVSCANEWLHNHNSSSNGRSFGDAIDQLLRMRDPSSSSSAAAAMVGERSYYENRRHIPRSHQLPPLMEQLVGDLPSQQQQQQQQQQSSSQFIYQEPKWSGETTTVAMAAAAAAAVRSRSHFRMKTINDEWDRALRWIAGWDLTQYATAINHNHPNVSYNHKKDPLWQACLLNCQQNNNRSSHKNNKNNANKNNKKKKQNMVQQRRTARVFPSGHVMLVGICALVLSSVIPFVARLWTHHRSDQLYHWLSSMPKEEYDQWNNQTQSPTPISSSKSNKKKQTPHHNHHNHHNNNNNNNNKRIDILESNKSQSQSQPVITTTHQDDHSHSTNHVHTNPQPQQNILTKPKRATPTTPILNTSQSHTTNPMKDSRDSKTNTPWTVVHSKEPSQKPNSTTKLPQSQKQKHLKPSISKTDPSLLLTPKASSSLSSTPLVPTEEERQEAFQQLRIFQTTQIERIKLRNHQHHQPTTKSIRKDIHIPDTPSPPQINHWSPFCSMGVISLDNNNNNNNNYNNNNNNNNYNYNHPNNQETTSHCQSTISPMSFHDDDDDDSLSLLEEDSWNKSTDLLLSRLLDDEVQVEQQHTLWEETKIGTNSSSSSNSQTPYWNNPSWNTTTSTSKYNSKQPQPPHQQQHQQKHVWGTSSNILSTTRKTSHSSNSWGNI
jgi:hypothetical protein